MRGVDILSASILLLCGATVAQLATQPEIDDYPDQYQHSLGTSDTNLPGFQLWSENNRKHSKTLAKLSPACRASMTQRIHCLEKTRSPKPRRPSIPLRWDMGLGNDTLTDLVCESGCGESIAAWFEGVERDCATFEERMLFPTQRGGKLWARWNEICFLNEDEGTGKYCGGKTCSSFFVHLGWYRYRHGAHLHYECRCHRRLYNAFH